MEVQYKGKCPALTLSLFSAASWVKKLGWAGSYTFPTETINIPVVPLNPPTKKAKREIASPKCCILDNNFPTRTKFSDRLKLRGTNALAPWHDAAQFLTNLNQLLKLLTAACIQKYWENIASNNLVYRSSSYNLNKISTERHFLRKSCWFWFWNANPSRKTSRRVATWIKNRNLVVLNLTWNKPPLQPI